MTKAYHCFFCNKLYEEENPIEVRCSIPWFRLRACPKCVQKIILDNNQWYIFHDWKVWTRDSRNDIRRCESCWKNFIPSEKAIKFHEWSSSRWEHNRCFKCMKAWDRWEVYCFECNWYHVKWKHFVKWLKHNFKWSYSSWWYINFKIHKESKSWNTNWTEVDLSTWYPERMRNELKELPFQEVRELPDNVIHEIDRFYKWWINWHIMTHYNYRDNVNITWELLLKFWTFEEDLRNSMFKDTPYYYREIAWYTNDNIKLKWFKNRDISEWLKQNKYRNMYFDSIDDDWYVVWKYIDIFWNERTKRESVNVFYQAQWLNVNNNSATMKLKYVLSSNLQHKLDAFLRNDAGNFNSCQRSWNSDWLAKWAYDTITNGCICPILIYKLDNLARAVWRITTRIMYDENWEMYILLERLYHDWSFSKQTERWEVYKQIVLDLKNQWYKVIVSNYSAHDESTLSYVETLWLNHTSILNNLYQPLRRLFKSWWSGIKDCWYYADWWTECLSDYIDWIKWSTDYLNRAYLL